VEQTGLGVRGADCNGNRNHRRQQDTTVHGDTPC
jgi:hypothetical protein